MQRVYSAINWTKNEWSHEHFYVENSNKIIQKLCAQKSSNSNNIRLKERDDK